MTSRLEVLVIDSDVAHRQAIEGSLVQAGYEIDSITHGEALGHISREDMSRYAAVVVSHTNPDATVTSRPRAGESVVQYIARLAPEVLPRVILLTPQASFGSHASQPYRVIADAEAPSQLAAAVRAVQR